MDWLAKACASLVGRSENDNTGTREASSDGDRDALKSPTVFERIRNPVGSAQIEQKIAFDRGLAQLRANVHMSSTKWYAVKEKVRLHAKAGLSDIERRVLMTEYSLRKKAFNVALEKLLIFEKQQFHIESQNGQQQFAAMISEITSKSQDLRRKMGDQIEPAAEAVNEYDDTARETQGQYNELLSGLRNLPNDFGDADLDNEYDVEEEWNLMLQESLVETASVSTSQMPAATTSSSLDENTAQTLGNAVSGSYLANYIAPTNSAVPATPRARSLLAELSQMQ